MQRLIVVRTFALVSQLTSFRGLTPSFVSIVQE